MGHGYTQKQCEVCGTTFNARNDSIKAGYGRYCSRKCFGIATRAQETKECEYCHKSFNVHQSISNKGGGRYCSQECKSLDQIAGENKTCLCCGTSFFASRSELSRGLGKFCGRKCFVNHNCGDNHPNWRGGGKVYRGPNWLSQKRLALARDKGACQICGETPQLGQRKNEVHHIIPIRQFNGDFLNGNDLNNLITLCPKHHKYVEWGRITLQAK